MYYRRAKVLGATYFFTVVIYNCQHLFKHPQTGQLLRQSLCTVKMYEKHAFKRVVEAIEGLLEVKYFRPSEQAAIELIFLKCSKRDVYVYVNQEDGTLVVDQRHPQISEELNQFVPHKIWERTYGQHIRYYWNMVNNQGAEPLSASGLSH